MKRALIVLAALSVFGGSFTAFGQQPAAQNVPRAGYIYPAGGQQGTTVQVVVGGQFLNGAFEVVAPDRDLHATVKNVDRPLNAQQLTALREQIQSLQPKAADPAIRQQLLTLRATIGDSQQRNRNPALADRVTVEIVIDQNAEPGQRHLRLQTPAGLSNPVVFVVGQLPEVRERDIKNSRADAELTVSLPVTVNGRLIPGDIDNVRQPLRQPNQYMPGDVDRYRFSARAGQDLVVNVAARDLMPYLADAVPGWFQAVATLYDAAGREVAFCDDYHFRPDPAMHYRIPADGDYVLEIRDAIFRGREDFVYRASIGELPFITHIFPLGAPADRRSTIEVAGWNLPGATMTVAARKQPGASMVSLRLNSIESNRLPFASDVLPEALERESGNSRVVAQSISLPIIVNGRIGSPGDVDAFSFKGRAGDKVIAEVIARRLESPLDSVVEIIDARGNAVARGDDREDKAEGMLTHHADAYVTTTLPADGTYIVRLADVQHKGGPEFGYRLRLSAPQPDFELRIAPSTLNAVNSANVPVVVAAVRKDGFAGEIALALKDAPDGTAISGGVIPAGQDRVRITLTAPSVAMRAPDRIRIEGRASIQGRTVIHEAIPADERQQAFAYYHLVPTDALRLSVAGRGGTRVPVRFVTPVPVRIPVGGSTRLRVTLPAAFQAIENLAFELDGAPEGFSISNTVVGLGRTSASFDLHAGPKVAPGARGNLIIQMSGERVPAPTAQNQTRRRVPLGALPALTYEIVK